MFSAFSTKEHWVIKILSQLTAAYPNSLISGGQLLIFRDFFWSLQIRKITSTKYYIYFFVFFLQAHCQSLKINNCPQLINEFGYEAVSRDNICKTQCSFVLNALNPEGTATGQARPHQNFFIESDTLQAPGFFGNIGQVINSQVFSTIHMWISTNVNMQTICKFLFSIQN